MPHGQWFMAHGPWLMAQSFGPRASGLRDRSPQLLLRSTSPVMGWGEENASRLLSAPTAPRGGARELLPTAKGCLPASSSLATASSRSVTQTALTCLQESPTLLQRLARDRTVATAKTSKTERITKQTDGLAYQGRATRHTSHRRGVESICTRRGHGITAISPRCTREVAAPWPQHVWDMAECFGHAPLCRNTLPSRPFPPSRLPASPLRPATRDLLPATCDLRPATCDLVLPFPHLAGLAHYRAPPPRHYPRNSPAAFPDWPETGRPDAAPRSRHMA
jgi:hypothetical protein